MWVNACVIAVVLAFGMGQRPAPTDDPKTAAAVPVLTEVQQLQVTNAALAKENWLLKAQQAATEYQKASEAFDKILGALQIPDYDLSQNKDTGKLEYVKKPPPKVVK